MIIKHYANNAKPVCRLASLNYITPACRTGRFNKRPGNLTGRCFDPDYYQEPCVSYCQTFSAIALKRTIIPACFALPE
jgi:hypothetical protein